MAVKFGSNRRSQTNQEENIHLIRKYRNGMWREEIFPSIAENAYEKWKRTM